MKSSRLIPVALGLVAFLVALALPEGRSFSDTSYLLGRVETMAPAYYNVAYLPVGQLFAKLFGGLLGTEGALLALSAACIGGGVFLVARLGLGLGLSPAVSIASGLLLGLSPAALFFGGVVEVHALEFLGASLAIQLAWSARQRPPAWAWLWLSLALAVALLAHLSNLLLLPGLVLLAWGPSAGEDPPRGCRFGRRGLPVALGLLVVLAVCAGALLLADFERWSVHPALQWLGTLIVFGRVFLGGLLTRGLYTPLEAAEYLRLELLLPHGLLVLGLAGGLVAAWGRQSTEARSFARRALWACLPALLILPQGGVLERGGYFMSYAPLLALLLGLGLERLGSEQPRRARRQVLLLGVLVVGQLGLALEARERFRAQEPDARIWARAAATWVQPGDSVLVSSLARNFALDGVAPGVHVRDLRRDLDLVPARLRPKKLEQVLAERLGDAHFPGDLWIDAALLPGLEGLPAGASPAALVPREPWQARLVELLFVRPPLPVSLQPLELEAAAEPGDPGLAGYDRGAGALELVRVRRRP